MKNKHPNGTNKYSSRALLAIAVLLMIVPVAEIRAQTRREITKSNVKSAFVEGKIAIGDPDQDYLALITLYGPSDTPPMNLFKPKTKVSNQQENLIVTNCHDEWPEDPEKSPSRACEIRILNPYFLPEAITPAPLTKWSGHQENPRIQVSYFLVNGAPNQQELSIEILKTLNVDLEQHLVETKFLNSDPRKAEGAPLWCNATRGLVCTSDLSTNWNACHLKIKGDGEPVKNPSTPCDPVQPDNVDKLPARP